MSYLSEWLDRHDITAKDGLLRSKLDPPTYYELLRGSKTIPVLALLAGKNLGMNADEVRHLGKTLDPDRWHDSDMVKLHPYSTDPNWPELVYDFDTVKNACKFGGKNLPRITTDEYCQWCGKLIEGRKIGARYCSDDCRARAKKTARILRDIDMGQLSTKLVRTCPVCKCLFIVRGPSSRVRYCSDFCESTAKSQKKHAI